MKRRPETYLGDGLYASFDGFALKLRAPRGSSDDEVYLEASVFDALVAFVVNHDCFEVRVPAPRPPAAPEDDEDDEDCDGALELPDRGGS